jgi:DNA repair protein RadC
MGIKLTAEQKSKPIYTSQDVWDIIHPIHMRENKMRRKKEYFWAFGIDRERYLQFAELLALGSENRVHIKPAEALRLAITKEAQYVIYIHNHPGGTLTPSAEDKDATDRLIKAAEVVDIKVVDHFIITETQYFSFNEAGLMKQLRESKTYTVLHEDEIELLKLQMQAEGKEEGLKEGKEIGKAEGLVEKAKEMAAKMLAAGEPVEKVMAYTGLGKQVVGKMKKGGS